jgi:putative tryptophan/tyrosine transport system substrate-binding protein
VKRRAFVAGLGALLAAPRITEVQTQKAVRIGYVGAWYSTTTARFLFDAFRQGLGDLGYVEGQTLTIDARWMEGMAADEAARLTADLLRSKVGTHSLGDPRRALIDDLRKWTPHERRYFE